MKKDLAIKLKKYAEQLAATYSNKDRPNNYNKETFKVEALTPLSESTALIEMRKYPTMKKALIFCYWIGMGGGQWRYFVPTYDHCVGMEKVREYLHGLEVDNFRYNFNDENVNF